MPRFPLTRPVLTADARAWWPAAVTVLAAGAVLALGDGVRERGDLAAYDPSVTAWMVGDRTPLLTAMARVVTAVGSEVSIGVLTALVVGWLALRRHQWHVAGLVGSCMVLAGGTTLVVKHLLERSRPAGRLMLGPVDTGYSFPSGHTLYSTVFFGLVAGLALSRTSHVWQRAAVVVGWVVASGLVGLSRVYLGYHWLTDVLAGWSMAVGVLGLGAVAVLLTRSAAEAEA